MKNLTILVVDDEPDLGELVAFEFELQGANVLNASNGKEAFEVVQKNDVDVIVSDIRMPGGDGVGLLDNVRNFHPVKPALVFMTGFADITPEEAYAKGAAAMFGKPFNRKELIETVGRSVLPYAQRWSKDYSQNEFSFQIDLTFEGFKNAIATHRFNIGQGGMFIALDDKLPAVSEHVKFTINFANNSCPPLEGDGIVRWVRRQAEADLPKGIGIEIKSMVGNNRDAIFKIIEAQETVAYIPKS